MPSENVLAPAWQAPDATFTPLRELSWPGTSLMVMPMPVPLLPLPRTQTPNEPVLLLFKPENVTTTSAEAAAPPPVLAMTCGALTGSEAMDSFAITPLRRPAARRTQNARCLTRMRYMLFHARGEVSTQIGAPKHRRRARVSTNKLGRVGGGRRA